MFIGHYGPAGLFASKRLKLWHAVLAVQLLDFLWAPLVILGFEHVRIVPGFTDSNHFDLYHMPFSHSLPMAAVWSVLGGLVYWVLQNREKATNAIFFASLVFSHWVLDFVAHVPDLPLWMGGPEVGLGLWQNRPMAFTVELLLFGIGIVVFALRSRSRSHWGWVSVVAMTVVAAGLQVLANWGPPPESPRQAAASALIAYSVFVLLAYWVDRTRRVPING